VPVVAIVTGLAVVLAMLPAASLPWSGPGPTPAGVGNAPPGGSRVGYLIDAASLRERARLAADGVEPYRAAVDDLLAWAETAVAEPATPDDTIRIDGTEGPFVDDARRVYGLGLAYVVTGEERYASAARATIRAWVDTARGTANTCPDHGGCQTSLIMGRVGPGFLMGADLLEGSASWTAADRDAFRAWLRDVVLPAASQRLNNWGDAGDFLRVAAADYVGDQPEFAAAIEHWRALIDLIEADGRIPEEVRRGDSGIQYTQEAIQYKVAVAEIASRRGIDLWSYQGKAGGTLRAAIDRLASYWDRPEAWPDHPGADVPSTGPFWEIAYARFRDPRWRPIIEDRRPYGDFGHSAIAWTTLTHGVPFEPVLAEGPSASPSARPTTSPAAEPSQTPSGEPSPDGVADLDRLSARLRDPWGDRLPVRIGWRTDPEDGPVDVERSVDGGAWRALSPDTTTRVDDEVPIDTPVDYRVRPADGGDAVPWSTIDDLRVRRTEPTAETVDLDGSWSTAASAGYSRGRALSTDQAEARLTWRGTARSLIVVGPVGPTRGRMIIDVDGERAEVVELYAPVYDARIMLFTVHWADGEEHEVRIEARHRSGRTTVAVDDLVTLAAAVSVAPGS
jgi:hypothetical protein